MLPSFFSTNKNMNGKIENAICITLTMSEFDDISIIDDTVRHSTIFVRGSKYNCLAFAVVS